ENAATPHEITLGSRLRDALLLEHRRLAFPDGGRSNVGGKSAGEDCAEWCARRRRWRPPRPDGGDDAWWAGRRRCCVRTGPKRHARVPLRLGQRRWRWRRQRRRREKAGADQAGDRGCRHPTGRAFLEDTVLLLQFAAVAQRLQFLEGQRPPGLAVFCEIPSG